MEMYQAAGEQFLPCTVVGLLLSGTDARCAARLVECFPDCGKVIFSLGVFARAASCRRQMFGVGAWYLAAGTRIPAHCLPAITRSRPGRWALPFGIGQLLVAPSYAMDSRMQLKKVNPQNATHSPFAYDG